jgi:hypothetical protein
MTRRTLLPAVAVLLAALGCDAKSPTAAVKSAHVTPTMAAAPLGRAFDQAPPAEAAAPLPGGKPAAPADPPLERKIIFNGHLELVVKDFDAARAEVAALIDAHKGYFAKSEVVGDAGTKRTGTFTIKVPAEKFQATVDALTKLGVATRNSTDSQDVTEEFVDVSARVRNLKAEEEVLNRLLRDAAGRLEDLFKIREQVRQNREQIERAEGRLKALAALAAMSTVVLTVREEANYVPPTVAAAPTFGGRVGAAFGESVGLLRSAAEWVVVALVAAAPWLPLAAVAGWLLRRGVRAAMTPPAARPTAAG